MKGMKRSSFRNVMLVVLLALIGGAVFLFFRCQGLEDQIIARQGNLIRLKQELENASRLNIALTELDQLTINEQTATQLDILRHLGLQQSKLDFAIQSRDVRNIGGTSLYVYGVQVSGPIAYPAALTLCDRLQSTNKIHIESIQLQPDGQRRKNMVNFTLTGNIYGLVKNEAGANG